MRDDHPGITVTYLESEEPEALGLLRDGLVDLAITSAFPGDRADPHRENEGTFDTVPLFTEPVVLALPASHPLAASDPVELAALADASWVAGCPVCRGHLLAACEAVGVEPRLAFENDNAVAVLNLVASELGVALLPRLALATAVVPEGAAIRSTSPSSDRSIRIVSQPGSRRVPAIATVLREIVQIDGRDWGLRHV